MARKSKQPIIACQYFGWRLFQRDGVYYADGRGGKYDLGKHSLGARNRENAFERLRQLDAHKAVEHGLANNIATVPTVNISIAEGWKKFLDFCGRSNVQGGVSPGTLKRYGGVRDKHVGFCARHGVVNWTDFDARMIEKYGNWLARKSAERTQYFELTLLKSVVKWLIGSKLLPADCKLNHPLRKPQGTDTYCYSVAEVADMVRHCESAPNLGWLARVIVGLRIPACESASWPTCAGAM